MPTRTARVVREGATDTDSQTRQHELVDPLTSRLANVNRRATVSTSKMSDYRLAGQSPFTESGKPMSSALVSMTSTLAALTSITSFLAHAYFTMGQTYYSLPYVVPGLRKLFTISEHRELPDLLTLFGMLQARILRARAAMLVRDEFWMAKDMWVANELICEAWWKVSWVDRALANVSRNEVLKEMIKDGEDNGEQFEKWRVALPDCCGACVAREREQDQRISSIETWLDGVTV